MKKKIAYILLASLWISSCTIMENVTNNTREFFYPTKSRFEVFDSKEEDQSKEYYYNYKDNYKKGFVPRNLFTLRIKEKEKYVKLDNGLVSELPYRHFFADTVHAFVDKDILEETYLYIDGLSDNKYNGLVIFFNTFPVISAEKDDDYEDSKKIFLDYTKSMKTGLWLRKGDDIYILFNTGKDDVPIKAQLIWKKENDQKIIKSVNFVEITHPQSIDKPSHKKRMKALKKKLMEYDPYKRNTSSNKFDITLSSDFVDLLINDYLTSTSLKMKNVFDVKKSQGLPFIVNSNLRPAGISYNNRFYKWTNFEVLYDHRIIFETEQLKGNGFEEPEKISFMYQDKYLNNLSTRE